MAAEVGVLDDNIAATCLAVGLVHSRNVVSEGGQARVMADLLQICHDVLQRSQDRLVGVLRAASVLLAGVEVITELVNDVPIARIDKRCRLTVAWLVWPAAIGVSVGLGSSRHDSCTCPETAHPHALHLNFSR